LVCDETSVFIGDLWLAHALLNQRVQKTEHFARLPRPSATGKGFCVAASFLILVATSLHAGEPAMTLAMNEPSGNNFAADNSSFNLKNSQPEVASLNDEKVAALSSVSQIENQTNSGQPESLQLVRESSQPNKPVTVQAGYGRIWDDQSTLQKISAGHQEPGCAYVSAKISF
jgi:hypothetical protein